MDKRTVSGESVSAEAVRHELALMLQSRHFAGSDRRSRFLEYIVGETLAGRADRLKGYSIGVAVFDRPADFDPMIDPVVRVEAGRLRDKLRAYFAEDGHSDTVRIDLPKGSYVPVFNRLDSPIDSTPSNGPAGPGRIDLIGANETPLKPSIAVLPFENLSKDPEQDYLIDGLTDNLITDLSKVSGLTIVSRHSSFAHRGTTETVAELATILDVRYIVEGSVRAAGDRVRISATLIDTDCDRTVWAERYDRTLRDVFDLQDDVSRSIVTALRVKLTPLESDRLGHRGSSSLAATTDLLLGIEKYWWRYTRSDHEEALRHFLASAKHDQNYAAAHAWISRAYIYQYALAWDEHPEQTLRAALQHAQRAVELDDLLPLGHAILGWVLLFDKQFSRAIDEGRRACSLDPNSADAHMFAGVTLACSGRRYAQEGLEHIEEFARLNPVPSALYFWSLGATYFCLGEYDKCIATMNRGTEFSPTFTPFHTYTVVCLALTNRIDDARAKMKTWSNVDPGYNVNVSRLRHGFEPEIFKEWERGVAILQQLVADDSILTTRSLCP